MPSKFHRLPVTTKLRLLLLMILIPLAAMICFVLAALVRYSSQYDALIENLTVASEFSFDFQKNLDYSVYRFVVSGGQSFEEYNPFEGIAQARGVVDRLKQTTVQDESRERLRMIEKFLDNLELGVSEIRDGGGNYSQNMGKLEGIIRPNTELVTESAYVYIYSESRALADLRLKTRGDVNSAIVTITVFAAVLIVLLCVISMRLASGITRPIKELCDNIRTVGEGDFTVRPVESHHDELQTLSTTFGSMVQRIGTLMENVKTEQENLRLTELKLLQAQINPHFLYNTFDTIIWLAEDHQDEQVVTMVTSLSNFFRTTLSKGRDFISVREEELHVCSYLEIQQFRYRDILTFTIHIPDTLNCYTVPKLTLQPLVENALYHGIKNKRGGGSICVTGTLEDDMLVFRVADNGIGMAPDTLARIRASIETGGKVGFGLANVHERIRLYFGPEYGLTINSSYGQGTTATVRFPAKEIPPFA